MEIYWEVGYGEYESYNRTMPDFGATGVDYSGPAPQCVLVTLIRLLNMENLQT
jgi:hypothetical protein